MTASEQMMAAVEQAGKQRNKATETFLARKKEIERLSSRQLDFFSSSFNSEVSEIARAVRKANDEAYAAMQATVVWLDETCRPLLKQNPSVRAVNEVAQMIRLLNEESEIETKFTGSINGSERSDLVNVNYAPSLSSQMIQKYWENAFGAMPGAAEETRAWNQRQAETQRAQQEAKDREEERRRKNRQAFYDQQARQAEERRQRNVENAPATEQRREYLKTAREMIGGSLYSFAWVKPDGTAGAVSRFPSYRKGTPGDVSRFRDLKSIVSTTEGIVGLKKDGTCMATNSGDSWGRLREVHAWSGIVALAAGNEHVVGLREDGTCVAVNVVTDPVIKRYKGQSEVRGWRDIQQIACGSDFTVGLRKNGTVVYTGDDVAVSAASWTDMVLIGAGCNGVVGVDRSGKLRTAGRINTAGIQKAENVVQLEIANGCAYALQADGIVRGGIVDRWGMMNGEDIVGRNIVAIAAGDGLYMLTESGNFARPKTSVSSYYSITLPGSEQLFSSYDGYLRKQQEEERRRREEQEEAERQLQIRQQLMAQRREAGTCQHCGAAFKRGLFGYKCISCGHRKDY